MGGIDTIVAVVKNPIDTAFARPRTTTLLLAKPAYEDSQYFSLCQSGAILSGRVLSRRFYQGSGPSAVIYNVDSNEWSIVISKANQHHDGSFRRQAHYPPPQPTPPPPTPPPPRAGLGLIPQAAGSLFTAPPHPTPPPRWAGLVWAGNSLNPQVVSPSPAHHHPVLGWELR